MATTVKARCTVRRHALDAMARVKLRQYAKTRKGRAVLAGNHMAYAITEHAAMGADGTMQGNNFILTQRQILMDGNADQECVAVLYIWLGNVLQAMANRYKRGNKTMRLGVAVCATGRRALRKANSRLQRLGKAGFSVLELSDFEQAIDLGLEFAPSLSKVELREVFRQADMRKCSFDERMQVRFKK